MSKRVFAVMLVAALSMTACAAQPDSTTAPSDTPVVAQGDTLVVAQGSDPQTFDPTQFATGNQSFMYQLYDPLVLLDSDGNPVPRLATSWTRSDDELSVTFTLRAATFHSGRPVTAQDVVDTFAYYETPEVGANLLERLAPITSVEATDDSTVVMHLSSPTPGLFDLLSTFFILDSGAMDSLSTTDAGSGPFMIEKRTPGVGFTMKKFDNHYLAADIAISTIEVKVISDSIAASGALQTGEVDLLLETDPLVAEQFKSAAGFKVERPDAAPITAYLMLNVSVAPLDNKLVRQALAYAIDRQKIADIAYPGTADPACQPWAPGHWAYSESLNDACSFDLDQAKALLDQAGVGPFTISVNTAPDAYSPGSVAAAQIIKEDFAKIGVDLEILTYEPAKARELLLASDFQTLIHFYSEGGLDPQSIFPSGLFGPGDSSRSKFTSPEYENLVDAANSTLDQAARKEAYAKVSAEVIDEAFLIPIAYRFRQYVMSDGVDGLVISGAGFPILENVTVK